MGLLGNLFSRPAPTPAPVRTRGFEAAGGRNRWTASPHFGRMGPETLTASPPTRGRARHYYANNPWTANGVNALTAGLVGAGITPASQHPDPETRARIGAAFTRWAKVADADGRSDYWGIQAAAARALVVDGEAFIYLETRPEGLRLRLLPAEMVDESATRELPNGGYVVAGIEFDASGHRVGYHVLRARPTDLFAATGATVRVPAEDMIHVMAPLGAGQVRGVSWLAPILLRLSELDQLEDALIVGTKVGAMFCGFLVDQNATGEPFEGTEEGGILTQGLEPGVLQRLPSGFDIRFSTPAQAQQTSEFIAHQIRAISAGLAIPAHLVSNDLREANYGSLRAGMIAYRQRLEQLQFGCLIPQICDPIFARAVSTLVMQGDLESSDFERSPSDYFNAEHYPPAQPWLDPQKDVAAMREALDAGLISRRQAVAERGYNVETLDAEIAADREREARLKLQFGSPAKGPENGDD